MFIIDKIVDIYKQNSDIKAYKRYQLCKRFTLYTEYIYKIGVLLYSLSVVTYYAYPLFMYFAENKLLPIVDLFLSGIDETTIIGYITYLVNHITLTSLAFLARFVPTFSPS